MELTAAESPPVAPRRDISMSTLDALIERNEIRTQLILNNPFFLLWREGKLDDDHKRRMLLKSLTILADTFGTSISAQRELSQLERLGRSRESLANTDPVLRTTSTRYRHEMLTLDDAGKAVLRLVLETAGYYLGVLADPIPARGDAATRFGTPVEREAKQREVYGRLVTGKHPYDHLHAVLEDAWDMLDESTTRIAALVSQHGW